MSLQLKVISFKGKLLPEPITSQFDSSGGSIGRSENCTLQLPDQEKYVSRHHASIKFDFGNYYLIDCSLSGVFINNQATPLHNKSQQLCNGMTLHIGEYQIAVTIDDQLVLGRESLGFAEVLSAAGRFPKPPAGNVDADINCTSYHQQDLAISGTTSDPNCPEALNEAPLIDAFLEGVGLDDHTIPHPHAVELMRQIGQMFRALVKGSTSLLRHHAEFKNFFRLNITVIKSANRNPLKAIISTDEVIRQMLSTEAMQDFDTIEAIAQGFNDVIDHQLAMQAGMQAALEHVIESFNPERIEQQFTRGLVLQKKAKCWYRYKASYHETAKSAVDNFYSDAFVEAYEKKLKILLSLRSKA